MEQPNASYLTLLITSVEPHNVHPSPIKIIKSKCYAAVFLLPKNAKDYLIVSNLEQKVMVEGTKSVSN